MINVCILPHPRFLKSSVVIDFFSQCYWLKQNWHVLTTPFQVTRGCRWETVTYNFHPTQMAQRRLATGLQLWTTSGSRESGMLCLFWLACIEILLTHMANSAMLVFIQSITRGPQVHHHSCKLRQQWLAKPRLCIISSSWPSGQHEKFPAAHCTCVTADVSWALVRGAVDWGLLALPELPTLKPGPRPTPQPCHSWLVEVFLCVVN